MTRGIGRTLAVAVLVAAAGGVAAAADPADTKALDKTVVDSLRDVHNYGADLYNQSRDYAGTYRVYDGALRAVKPLLGHRPAVQKAIDDGLAAAGKEVDPARRAFLLHETIEGVRADLKGATAPPKKPTPDEPKKTEEPKKTTEPKKPAEPSPKPPMPETKKPEEPKKSVEPKPKTPDQPAPMPKPKPKEADTAGDSAAVSGVVTFEGKPLPAGEVTFVSLDLKSPKVVTTTIKDGKYSVKGLPPGKYKVMIDGGKNGKLPAKYSTSDTSGLTAETKAGSNTFNFDLK